MIFRGRLSAVFSVTVLYCFVMGIVHAHLMPSTTGRLNDPLKEQFFAVAVGNLWCHTVPSETSVTGSRVLTSNHPKIHLFAVPPVREITGLFCGEQFRQYAVYAGVITTHCCKSVLIFPFNYFW